MIVEMKKLTLIGHSDVKEELLTFLRKTKNVEISKTRDFENTVRLDHSYDVEHAKLQMSRISFAFSFLKDVRARAILLQKRTEKTEFPYVYTQLDRTPVKRVERVSFDEFDKISSKEEDLMANVADLEEISARMKEIEQAKVRLQNESAEHAVYLFLKEKYSFYKGSRFFDVIKGVVPSQKAEELSACAAKYQLCELTLAPSDKLQAFCAVIHRDEAEAFRSELQGLEFAPCQFDGDESPAEAMKRLEEDALRLELESRQLMTRALVKELYTYDLKLLYDFYMLALQRAETLDKFATTAKSFALQAWYPAEFEGKLVEKLDTFDCAVYELSSPEEGEVVPTYVKNSKIVEPYQDITNLYSVPAYGRDLDPNPVMSFFYFLMFGMMIADAAYGILLAIGSLIVYRIKKPVPGKGRLLLIIAMGGVSTLIWGAIFGGWFGLPFDGLILGGMHIGPILSKIQLINPLEGNGPLILLGISFGIGFLHIVTGMFMNAVNLIRKKRVLDALAEVGTWYLVFAGVIILALGLIFFKQAAWVKYVGIGVAAAGAVLIPIANMRGKKGVKKLTGFIGGFGKLYDGVNIISDILSYARLFGLGLSGSVVALVVNQICAVVLGFFPQGSALIAIGYIICVAIFLVGHVFNIAISTLGAYVHNCRLQFIEFYGKFYEGGGHMFIPYGTNTKYTYLE